MTVLSNIAREIRGCRLCPLCRNRINAVPGEGPEHPRLVFVGEGPGREEDLQGKPFVGRAGKLLDHALASAGIVRGDVFVTSVVKCRPAGNRAPRKREIDVCVSTYLDRQIALLNPEIVCLLGATAAKALLGANKVLAVRGRLIERARSYFVTFHPAAAGRNPAWRNVFQADLQQLAALLTDAGSPGSDASDDDPA